LIEALLGVNLEGDQLRLTPHMPKSWTNYKIHYRYRQTVYHITITRRDTEDVTQLLLDGKVLAAKTVPLVDDRQEHFVVMNVANA
jgi:cellobiose phosphorylase